MRAAALPLLPMVLVPAWFGKPLAGLHVRLYQTLAKELQFDLELVLKFNGIYSPEKKTFSPGYEKDVSFDTTACYFVLICI